MIARALVGRRDVLRIGERARAPPASIIRSPRPTGASRARDGFLNIAAANDAQWRKLAEALGRPEWLRDPRYARRARAPREPRRAHARDRGGAARARRGGTGSSGSTRAGVPCGPVLDIAQVFADPQVLAREMLVELPHPELGTFQTTGLPVKLSRTPGAIERRPPLHGEHTDEVLRECGVARRRDRRAARVRSAVSAALRAPRRDRLAARLRDDGDGGRPRVGDVQRGPARDRLAVSDRGVLRARPGCRASRSPRRSSSRAGSRTCARRRSCSCRAPRSRCRRRAAPRAASRRLAIDRHLVARGLVLIGLDAAWLSLGPVAADRALLPGVPGALRDRPVAVRDGAAAPPAHAAARRARARLARVRRARDARARAARRERARRRGAVARAGPRGPRRGRLSAALLARDDDAGLGVRRRICSRCGAAALPASDAARRCAAAGLAALALFAVVRGWNGYGNMAVLRDDGSLVQWLHVAKYPPSLAFSALELGLMALLLAALLASRRGSRRRRARATRSSCSARRRCSSICCTSRCSRSPPARSGSRGAAASRTPTPRRRPSWRCCIPRVCGTARYKAAHPERPNAVHLTRARRSATRATPPTRARSASARSSSTAWLRHTRVDRPIAGREQHLRERAERRASPRLRAHAPVRA